MSASASTPATVDLPRPDPGRRPHDEPADEHGTPCTMVVHLGVGHSTTGLLKVLSVLHSRRVAVSHVQYVQCPDRSAVMIVECSPATAPMETVRKSVANAVPVVSVSVHSAPGRDGVRRLRSGRGTHR
ncbi:hypothetical protein EAD96_17200 [Micromonospora sp. BL1]|uniref:hypothetical protein n=1 Tax=Micromonospora sp. BL1 TaxID=2478709 RepID=UPI000EF58073|nr:hypothetical protein [Micromonospora sp. BL1]RLQ03930.1 hypothetical protein EAD96_17200 [Micromonospora sp. BL1]